MPTSRPVPQPLTRRPFTTAEARAYGVSATALGGTGYRQLFDGVHACSNVPLSLRTWVDAARLVLPADAVLTGVSALHPAGVMVGPPWPLRWASAHPHPVRREGLTVARVDRLPPHVGVACTAQHAFVVACTHLDLVDAVVAGDWLVLLGRTTPDELAAYAATRRGRGAVLARSAAALVRARAESPRESYVRLLLVLAGLPEPRCNVVIGTAAGPIGRGDLVYDEYALVVEYDGRQHAESAAQWERDLDRLDDFSSSRWRHLRVTAARLRRPRDVVHGVHAALREGGYRGPAPVFGPRWVALFETRTAAQRSREAPHAGSWP